MKKLFLFFVTLFPALHLIAQDKPPATDIWLMDIQSNAEGKIIYSNAEKITDNPGYDNQPFFMPDGKSLLYTSIREDGQSDIYQYNIITKQTVRITATSQYKEYSPMLTPDGKYISCVRVEPDDSTQHLCRFPIDGAAEQEILLPDIKNIGYYCWIGEESVALFLLGKSFTLQIANIVTGAVQYVDDSIGRCMAFKPFPGKLFYVKKISEKNWRLKTFDISSGTTEPDDWKLPEGSEDYCLFGANTNMNVIWAADAPAIITLYEDEQGRKEILSNLKIDFTSEPFNRFYRIAFSEAAAKLAIVTFSGNKP